MLTIYSFLPLFGVSLVAFAISADTDWVPVWFKASTLPISYSIELAAFTLALFWVFYKNEKYILYAPVEQKEILSRVGATTVMSVFFLGVSSVVGIEVDFRELSQALSLNIFYNILRLITIFFYFGLFGRTKVGALMSIVAIGFFNAFSGSKASMLTPLLIAFMVIGRLNARAWLLLVLVSLAFMVGLIPAQYLVRYIDPALSAYQTTFIYHDSGTMVISYYIETILNALSGTKGYNPIKEYLNDTGLAQGYNLTPTVIGEMMGSGTVVGLLILFFITFYLWLIKRLWLQRGPLGKRYFSVGFFVLISTMQSSLMDIVFYIPYFFIALGFIKIAKALMTKCLDLENLTPQLRSNLNQAACKIEPTNRGSL